MSKNLQLGGFVIHSTIKEIISPPANSIKNSFVKLLKNKDSKEIDSHLFEDTGLNTIGKKIRKGI